MTSDAIGLKYYELTIEVLQPGRAEAKSGLRDQLVSNGTTTNYSQDFRLG